MQGPVLFRHAAFVPPGYASLLFAHLEEPSSCPLPTTLFAGFRRFLLGAFGLGEQAAGGGDGGEGGAAGDGPLIVRLVTRRPGRSLQKVARQIANEAQLVAALEALDGGGGGEQQVEVSVLDLAALSREPLLLLLLLVMPLHAAGWHAGWHAAD